MSNLVPVTVGNIKFNNIYADCFNHIWSPIDVIYYNDDTNNTLGIV